MLKIQHFKYITQTHRKKAISAYTCKHTDNCCHDENIICNINTLKKWLNKFPAAMLGGYPQTELTRNCTNIQQSSVETSQSNDVAHGTLEEASTGLFSCSVFGIFLPPSTCFLYSTFLRFSINYLKRSCTFYCSVFVFCVPYFSFF